MSDPKREDLRWFPGVHAMMVEDVKRVSDAEFDAIARQAGYTDQADAMSWEATARQLGRVVEEWERLGVKVWEDCPKNRLVDGEWWCDGGCDHCDGTGKVLAKGVFETADGLSWIVAKGGERR